MAIKRVILIIIDGCGVGELPDASAYNDIGCSTLSNCADAVGGLLMPTCQSLGLGNIVNIKGLPSFENPIGSFGKMSEISHGKDSTSGHWEIAGLITDKPFPTYPDGFPAELINNFEKTAQIKIIGNCQASGTEIIERLGEQHLRTKEIILYTSADSVFQLAAHEDIYSLNDLYKICQTARDLLVGDHAVGRVIARPFNGESGNFCRTYGRKDFSVKPPHKTMLNFIEENNYKTLAIGKIFDLFAGVGISTHIKTNSNFDGLQAIKNTITKDTEHKLLFANLVDFDEHCGHRRDPQKFADALQQFDTQIGEILPLLQDDDLLIISADHGCDPTFAIHTDHTREYVPLLVYNKLLNSGTNLGTRNSFSDIAKTICDIFKINNNLHGTSFIEELGL